jgi:hypothetical protein
MRGGDDRRDGLFSYVSLEARIPKSHPLRPVRRMLDEALEGMSKEFDGLYAATGRRSIVAGLLRDRKNYRLGQLRKGAGRVGGSG